MEGSIPVSGGVVSTESRSIRVPVPPADPVATATRPVEETSGE